ncbi:MAG: sigma 54-interacting transcriptional regulator [Bacillota bacterium]
MKITGVLCKKDDKDGILLINHNGMCLGVLMDQSFKEDIPSFLGESLEGLILKTSITKLFSGVCFDDFNLDVDNQMVNRAKQISMLWFINALEVLDEGILIVDKDCIIRYVNKSFLALKKKKKEELLGRRVQDVLKPAVFLPKAIQTGKPQLNNFVEEGVEEHLVSCYPIKEDKEGAVIAGLTVTRNITNLKQMSKKLQLLEKALKTSFKARYTFDDIIGDSKAITEVKKNCEKAASSDSNVLITGESGTGKELFAHGIHNASSRNAGPFIIVNCAAIPKDLIESELFGYEGGSFTDARKGGKIGLFEMADGGTIFLDEIGDLDLAMQVKLLRFLQDRKLRRIGSVKEVSIDVRIIAATNRDLDVMVEQKQFRQDLYYRLHVMPIRLPALRERKQDIKCLSEFFLKKYCFGRKLKFSSRALEKLVDYNWPGNVRELENAIEFSANMAEGTVIYPKHLPPKIVDNYKPDNASCLNENDMDMDSLAEIVADAERRALKKAVLIYGNCLEGKKQIAKQLKISLATLYNKLKQYGINA